MARSTGAFRSSNRAPTARRLWTMWTVLFALFVQLAVPFSQALAFDPEQGGEFQVICTANGIRQIAVDADGVPLDEADAVSCPFCFLNVAPALFEPVAHKLIEAPQHSGPVFVSQAEILQHSIWRGGPNPSRAPPLSV